MDEGGSIARPATWSAAASELPVPLYAAANAGPVVQSGYGVTGLGKSRSLEVSVRHQRAGSLLEVATANEIKALPIGDEWSMLMRWLRDSVTGRPLTFPLTLTVDRWEQQVPVEGVPTRFVFVGDSDRWRASGSTAGARLTLAGSHWPAEGLEMVRIDPEDVRPVRLS